MANVGDELVAVARRSVVVAATVAGIVACGAAVSDAAASVTTRLVRGPAVFRLTDYKDQPSTTSYGDYRYAIVFKLNRDPQGQLPARGSLGKGRVSRGSFELDGYDTILGHLYPVSHAPAGKRNCFVGYVDDTNAAWLREEARKPLGTRVRVTLHPYTIRSNGDVAFGHEYVRRPHLQPADVRFRTPDARRRLRKIGC